MKQQMSKHERLAWLLSDPSEYLCLHFQSALRHWQETGIPLEECLGIAPDTAFRPVQAEKNRKRDNLLVAAARALPPSSKPWVGLTTEIKAHNRRWRKIRSLPYLSSDEWGTAQEFLFLARQVYPDKPLPCTRSLRRILKDKTPPIVTVIRPGYDAVIVHENGATTPMLNLHERIQLWEQHRRRVVRNPDDTATEAEATDPRPLFYPGDAGWQQDTPVAELLRQGGMLIPPERTTGGRPNL
jgi:hypothetical protein